MSDLKDRIKQSASKKRSHATKHVEPDDVLGTQAKEKTTVRFTLDLDKDKHTFLKTFALKNEVKASVVMRTLLERLEEDDDLRVKVQANLAVK